MPHADYPSATACICVAFAEVWELYLQSQGKTFFYSTTLTKGCSMKEPGATPSSDITLSYTTKEDFLYDCTESRLYAGVHFQDSIDAAVKMCTGIGVAGWERHQRLFAGDTSMY